MAFGAHSLERKRRSHRTASAPNATFNNSARNVSPDDILCRLAEREDAFGRRHRVGGDLLANGLNVVGYVVIAGDLSSAPVELDTERSQN